MKCGVSGAQWKNSRLYGGIFVDRPASAERDGAEGSISDSDGGGRVWRERHVRQNTACLPITF